MERGEEDANQECLGSGSESLLGNGVSTLLATCRTFRAGPISRPPKRVNWRFATL